MARYHINPETQRPNICTATKEPCKYAVDGQEPDHYSTKEEANAVIAAQAAAENSAFITLSRRAPNLVSREGRLAELRRMFPRKPALQTQVQADENVAQMIAEREAMIEGLTSSQEYALDYYAMSGHRDINGYLRHGDISHYYDEDTYGDDPEEKERITQLVGDRIHTLDQLMEQHGSGDGVEPRLLYRFIKVPEGETPESFAERLALNGEVKDLGYTSTTEDPSFIHSHVSQRRRRGNKYVVMEILTSQGISMQRDHQRDGNVQSLEQERLLPRELQLASVGIVAKTYSTGDDRVHLLKHYAPYFYDPNHTPSPPKAKRMITLQLVDESLLEKKVEGED